ncbi:MAG: DUF305 domain-containing protein [Actinomycetes bacterium]
MSGKRWSTAVAGTVGVALALTACGGTGEPQRSTPSPTTRATATTSATAGASASSGHHDEADVKFLQEMVPHHAQAVQMSDILLAKSGVDDRVRALAQQIKAAQAPEIEHMNGLLHDWGEPEGQETSSHGMSGGGMSGMMSPEQMQQLRAADGPKATLLYLQQMVQHHEGAVQMARSEMAGGENPEAKQLAQSIIDSQQAEIEHMKSLLSGL